MAQTQELAGRAIKAIGEFRRQNRQLFNLIAAAAGLAAAICAALYLINPGAPVVLASNLAPADRTALALRLRRHNIDFTLGADSITVPGREVADARRLLEMSPGFAGGGEDFGLFDRSTMGQSDFDEQVNYQRSLQGELERTIMDIRGIDSARVMLAMGRPSPFALGPSEAERASVMLTTAPGASLDGAMARAVAHLVASSVSGLSTENVTITANDGVILYPPQHDGELGEAMRLRNDFERRLEEKVSALLGRVMGDNRYAVEVSVDVDTSRVTSHDQLYGKGDQAILSEEHTVTPAGSQTGGIPGLTSNLPVPSPSPTPAAAGSNAAGGAPTKVASETRGPEAASKDIVNYKPSSREINTVTAPVRIKRISVAAVLDGTYDGGHFRPLPAERLSAIKGLVAAAIGAETERGDFVDIQSAALSQPYVPPVPNPVAQLRTLMSDPIHLYGAIGAGVVIALLMLWMIKRAISRRLGSRHAAAAVSEVAQDAAAPQLQAPNIQIPAPSEEKSANRLDYEEIRTKVNEEAARNPEAAAEILRKWISEGAVLPNEPQVTG